MGEAAQYAATMSLCLKPDFTEAAWANNGARMARLALENPLAEDKRRSRQVYSVAVSLE